MPRLPFEIKHFIDRGLPQLIKTLAVTLRDQSVASIASGDDLSVMLGTLHYQTDPEGAKYLL